LGILLTFLQWSLCSKATISHFTAEKFRDFIFLCPNLQNQDQIVNFLDKELDKLDSIIAQTWKIIDKLNEYRSSLISAAVTGKINVRHWQEKDLVNLE
jgi:restriction endonuclease S subunit